MSVRRRCPADLRYRGTYARASLVRCEYENMAYSQIAELLGASVPQVKTWLHRGRKQLAEMLGEFMAPMRPRPTLAAAPRERVRPIAVVLPEEKPASLPATE